MIIWAEASNCPYWPAKLMKSFMKDDELHVNVRFFGDYTVYNVPASNCFLYSKNRPDENILEDNSELYRLALNVSCSFFNSKVIIDPIAINRLYLDVLASRKVRPEHLHHEQLLQVAH